MNRKALSLSIITAMLATAATSTALAHGSRYVPDTAALAGPLARQTLVWETCDFGSDSLNERFNLPNTRCATVKVPRDWRNPRNGLTWNVRISFVKNVETKSPRYISTMFVNPGGPGGSGLPWGPAMNERTPQLRSGYNYVGFDPRGVGQSSNASCMVSLKDGLTSSEKNREIGRQCSRNPDVRTINTEQTVYDMDFIRHLLGLRKISYVGYSYGTWLGTWYMNVFGSKFADRFLLDSSVNATTPTLQPTWDIQGLARDRQFAKHLMNWIARNNATYGLGTDPEAIYDGYWKGSATLSKTNILLTWLLSQGYSAFSDNQNYPMASYVVKAITMAGVEAQKSNVRALSVDAEISLLNIQLDKLIAQNKDGAQAALQDLRNKLKILSRLPLIQDTDNPNGQTEVSNAFEFIRCNDGQWTQGSPYWEAWNAKMKRLAPLSDQFGSFNSVPVCAHWPTSNRMPRANPATFPNTIVVQSELDSQTAWEGGYITGTRLPNTSFIAIDNEGSHGIFPYGSAALDAPILAFFLTGQRPKNISVVQALPLPREDVTYESWAPLRANARHGRPVHGPWQITATHPARTMSRSLPQLDNSMASMLAKQERERMLADIVRKYYGKPGLKALDLDK